jgi:parvulin-like peptidyl-prolyl isomerase
MSQIILTITDESILENLLWVLKRFENDGVQITKRTSQEVMENQKLENIYTDEYIKENWEQIIRNAHIPDDYYKSEQYIEDRVKDWEERGKI